MKKYKLKFLEGVVVLLLLMFLVNTSYAALTIKNPIVKNVPGSTVQGATVQLIIGSDTTTLNQAPDYITGTLHDTQFPNTNAQGVAVATILDLPLNTNVYLKAWGDATPGPGKYYGYIAPRNTGPANILNRLDNPKIILHYIAAKPGKPTIGAPSVAYIFSRNKGDFVAYATIPVTPNPNYELATVRGGKYHIKITNSEGATVIEADADSANYDTGSSGTYLDLKTAYKVRAFARNHFLTNDSEANWSDEVEFNTEGPTGGGGAPPGPGETKIATADVTVELKSAGLGINSVSLPFTKIEDLAAETVHGLIKYINNAKSSGANVQSIAFWDAQAPTPQIKGILITKYDNAGNVAEGSTTYGLALADILKAPLRPGGYVIGVKENATVTFKYKK